MAFSNFFVYEHAVSKILLSTLNSTYQHTSFGLRYLKANLKELEADCEIQEFTISQKPEDIVEKILIKKPLILGFGVYIWNTQPTYEVISLIKKIAPEIVIVLGGPEVSYETESQAIVQVSDYVIKGEADFQFYELSSQILSEIRPDQKIWKAVLPAIDQIKTPYHLFNETDLTNRILYVEASRGCPYKCEYCLSSLDVTVRNFPINPFLNELELLIQKGARTFKFVDRTFNLSPKISTQILEFFLKHSDKQLFLHFEMVPDRLPDELKYLIEQFPVGSLQFEIGIQTWNPSVAANVSRRQDYKKIIENLNYLKEKTKVHSHVDLIVGLPGENLESFANGFNQLVSLNPDEIQVGILKRLKGAPISRHDQKFEMVYADHSPFQILKTKDISYLEIQQMNRFAKYWDQISNSGHFKTFINELKSKTQVNNASFFHTFLKLSDFLFEKHGQAHAISLLSLTESLWEFLTLKEFWDQKVVADILIHDYSTRGRRDIPNFLKNFKETQNQKSQSELLITRPQSVTPKRQLRHLQH